MSPWLLLAGGGMLLYLGAEWFVGGASALALALRVPQILVGLTVVAYGTSAPEVIVGLEAALKGHGDVALGNVVGSNVANIGLILGVSALIKPARVDGSLRRRELPMLVASAAVVPLLLVDGVVRAWEGAALLLVAVGYTAWMILAARAASVAAARADARHTSEAADAAGAPRVFGVTRSLITAAVGLGALLVGGNVFVGAAVGVARSLGMTERLVGLTIVAVGTSLPELITSTIAARRGHSDIAVGNVVGSNIFNTFLCLGSASLAGVVGGELRAVSMDLTAMLVMTLLAAAMMRVERTITRAEGAMMLALYAAFTAVTVARG